MSCMLHSATTSSAMVPTFSIKTPHAPPATIQSLQPSVVKLPMTQLVPPKKAEEALMNYRSRPGVRRPEVRKHSLAHVWRKIQGCDDWKELIDPLHPLLRAEVVRYGELVNACYKAFDLDRSSDRYLNCKYGKARMMTEVGMDGCGYQVTKYVYATADVAIPMQEASATCSSRWIGYVAVASDEQVARIGRRDVMVAFRGTVTSAEWAANFMSSLTPANLDPQDPRPDVMVETGFLSLYTSDDRRSSKFSQGSLREQLLGEVSRLFSKYKDEEVSITLVGHSMGSALAQLLAYDLAELGLTTFRLQREIMITVYSFGGPRVGNPGFKQRCEELGLKVLRVANAKDPVTKLPGVFLNESFSSMAERYKLPWSWSCYTHVGVELPLDFFSMENPASAHDLGEYINLLKWCPTMAHRKDDGAMNLLGGARKLLRKQKIGTWSLQDTARQVGDLVQFLGLI